jgi:hypothetical protein
VRPIYRTTAPLTSRCCILYIYSTNINTFFFNTVQCLLIFSSKCCAFCNAIFFCSFFYSHFTYRCAKIYMSNFGAKRLIQSKTSQATSWTSILILFSHLRRGVPHGLTGLGCSHQNPVRSAPLPFTRHKPAHLILLEFTAIAVFSKPYRSWDFLVISE